MAKTLPGGRLKVFAIKKTGGKCPILEEEFPFQEDFAPEIRGKVFSSRKPFLIMDDLREHLPAPRLAADTPEARRHPG
jgi:hypothetical protein